MTTPIRWFRARSRALRAVLVVGAVAVLGVTLGTTGAVAALGGIFADAPGAPANDELASASVLTAGAAGFTGTTAGATAETDENDTAAGDRTVWYSWTPDEAGTVLLLPGSDTSAVARVYTGAGYPLTRVDTVSGNGASGGGASQFTASAGTAYLIQVDSADDGGSFAFDIWLQPSASGPGNDDLFRAASLDQPVNESLGGGTSGTATVQGTTLGGTTETGEPAGATHSVWYSWTVPDAGATLHVSVDAGLTLGVFTGDDVAHLSTVTADASGAVTLSGDAGTRLYVRVGGAEAAFTLTAAASGVTPPDTTPPTVTCTPPTGWTASGAVPCTASDAGSGLADSADAAFTLTPDVPAGTTTTDGVTPTRTVCDLAGNCVDAGPFTGLKIDTAPPVVSCAPTPATWTDTQASVACTATDSGAGLEDDADASFTLSTAVPAGTATSSAAFATHAEVCDSLGNCAKVPAPQPARVDLAGPTVSCGHVPNGWSDQPVTIDCTATDAGSGLASQAQEKFTLGSDVGDAAFDADATTDSVQVCDVAGNCVPAGPLSGLRVDRQLPVVQCTPPTGWLAGTSASVSCAASDDGSGLAAAADASFTLHASIAPGTASNDASTGSRSVCDVAGNCVTAGPFTGIELDDQPPTVTCGSTPTIWLSTPVTVDCTATDGDGSGVLPDESAFGLSGNVDNGTASDHVSMPAQQVCDEVGNCVNTPALAAGKVDRVLPQIVCDTPGGVHHSEVTVTCTSSDVGSGLADPADATFTLRTDVGAGHKDAAAMTGSRPVCDVAGNCVTAGPVGPFDVDRTVLPATHPALSVPTVVHVLSARPRSATAADSGGAGAVEVPFDAPTATAAAGVAVRTSCSPQPGDLFPLGVTTVVCDARDDADQVSTATFPVDVTLAPQLAPDGPARLGAPWQARGSGFAADSRVQIELDGRVIGSAYSTAAGLISVPVTLPADAGSGAHTLVLRGIATDGQPQLVVAPLTTTVRNLSLPETGPTLTGAPPPTSPTSGSGSGSPSSPHHGGSPTHHPGGAGSGHPTHGGSGHSGSSGPSGSRGTGGTGPAGGNGTATGTSTSSASGSGAGPSGSPTPQTTFGGGPQTGSPGQAAYAGGAGPGGGLGWWWVAIALAILAAVAVLLVLLLRARGARA